MKKNDQDFFQDDIPKDELASFNSDQLKDPDKALRNANLDLIKTQINDYAWRVKNRGRFGWSIMILLYAQHAFVFGFIVFSYIDGSLSAHEWLIGGFFASLLASTFFTANHLIKWLFTEINYQLHKYH